MRSNCRIALVLLSLLLISTPTAVMAEEETGEVAGLNLQAYAPARILISYAYTNNFSVTDVSCMGKSLYKITSGPTSVEFRAEDVDRYTFTVDIKYSAMVAQSIQIAVFSSNYAPEGVQINVKSTEVRIKFTLTVTNEPMYPSAQEVAEQVVLQVASQLSDFERETNRVIGLQNRNLESQWALIVFNSAVNIIVILTLLFWIRPRVKGETI